MPQEKTLAEMGAEVLDWAARHGFHPREIPFPEAIALLHSECSEALEAWRDWGFEDATSSCVDNGIGEAMPKPEGVGSEFGDILIRLVHYASYFGVDLAYEYQRKMAYNETREYRNGGKLA